VKFLKDLFTDTAGRWEIKTMVGLLLVIVSVVYAIATRDWDGFTRVAVFAGSFFGLSTATDAIIDVARKSSFSGEGKGDGVPGK